MARIFSVLGAAMVSRHARSDAKDPMLDWRAWLKILELTVNDEKYVLNRVVDLEVSHAKSSHRAPHETKMSIVDLTERRSSPALGAWSEGGSPRCTKACNGNPVHPPRVNA